MDKFHYERLRGRRDMRNDWKLRALAWEARRRGISYGQLSARLHPGEDEEIYARYKRAQAQADEKLEEAVAKIKEGPKRSKTKPAL